VGPAPSRMTIYCDESGGVGAGVMTMAAVSLEADAADLLLARMRDVAGIRGELKGSRIDVAERAFCIEMLMRLGGRAVVATADMGRLRGAHGGTLPEDIDIYAALLDRTLSEWIIVSGGCITVEIDDGRYDPRLNGLLRAEVQESLGQWGSATLADSRRSAGVQIADVLANSHYQIGINTPKARRIETLLAPFVADGRIRRIAIDKVDGSAR
jgi:hypothetical protein